METMNTNEIASRIAAKVFEWELDPAPAKTLEEFIAAELDKELKPLVEGLESLAYIGDSRHPDHLWKTRCLEQHEDIKHLRAQLAEELNKGRDSQGFPLSKQVFPKERSGPLVMGPVGYDPDTGRADTQVNLVELEDQTENRLRREICQLRAQLAEAQSVNKRVHDELLAEKEQVARMKSRHESNKAVVDGVWKQHEEQFEQLKTQLAEAQKERDDAKRYHDELSKAVEKRLDSLEPKIENLVQERDQLKAQLASEQEKGRSSHPGRT